jgi:uncharacterized protein Yka (UPF0111/DUF47 family)
MSSFASSAWSIRRAVIISLLALSVGVGISKAEDSSKSSSSKTAAAAETDQTSGVLRGEVRQVEVSLTRIRDLSTDVNHVKREVRSLYDEATRKVVHIQSSPNIIGTTVINIPYRFETGEYMPPRRKQVLNYISEIGPTLKLLKENVEETESGCRELLVPESLKDDFREIFSDWSNHIKKANTHFDNLEEYVSKEKLTNEGLGSKALQLGEDMKGMEVTLKTAFKLVKTSLKKNKNEKFVPVAENPAADARS